MKTENLNIFLDESGKKSTNISLIGAISIPTKYYESLEIQRLNERLRHNEFKMHFTAYDKRDYRLYVDIIQKITELPDQVQLNLFLFQRLYMAVVKCRKMAIGNCRFSYIFLVSCLTLKPRRLSM